MSAPTPEQLARAEMWIREQARTQPLEAVRDRVAAKVEGLIATVQALPPDVLVAAEAEGEWTPMQVLQHAAAWNWQVGEDILHVSLTGERPGNPLPEFEADTIELARRYRESLDSIWAHVSAADPEGFLGVTWEHPFFHEMNWREWYVFLGVHATDHTNQVKEAAGG